VSEHSRRGFLKVAGISTVAASVVALPGLSGTAEAESSAPAHESPFVAWVKDPKAGEIAILVGTSELVYTDKKLAKRLAQAAARAHKA
jgi:hypothetical protein